MSRGRSAPNGGQGGILPPGGGKIFFSLSMRIFAVNSCSMIHKSKIGILPLRGGQARGGGGQNAPRWDSKVFLSIILPSVGGSSLSHRSLHIFVMNSCNIINNAVPSVRGRVPPQRGTSREGAGGILPTMGANIFPLHFVYLP